MSGQTQAQGAIQGGMAPWQTIAGQSGGFLPLYAGALGAGTPAENTAAQGAFQASPGYQYTLNQGLESADRRAGARGNLAGNTPDEIAYAQNLSNQDYQQWLNNLFQGVGVNENAAGGIQSGQDALANSLAERDNSKPLTSLERETPSEVNRQTLEASWRLLRQAGGQNKANTIGNIQGAKNAAGVNTLDALFGLAGLGTGIYKAANPATNNFISPFDTTTSYG